MTIHDTIAQIEAMLKAEDRMISLQRQWVNPLTGKRSGIAVCKDPDAVEWQSLVSDMDERRTVAIESLPKLIAYIRALERVRDETELLPWDLRSSDLEQALAAAREAGK